jgi:hypothetical protein
MTVLVLISLEIQFTLRHLSVSDISFVDDVDADRFLPSGDIKAHNFIPDRLLASIVGDV